MKPKNHQVQFWTAIKIATILLTGRLSIFFRIYEMLHLLPNLGLVGSQCLKRTKKNIRSTSTLVPKWTVEMKISDLSASFEDWQKIEFEEKRAFFGLVEVLKSEIFIWKWILAQTLTLGVRFFFGTFETLGTHHPSIWKKMKHFMRRPVSKIWWFLGFHSSYKTRIWSHRACS